MMEGRNWYIKWFMRILLSEFNRLLIKKIRPEKVKTFIAGWIYHREIDISHPQKLNEKILWMEYNTDATLRSRLTDKYEVRQFVAEKGYENCLVPLYGIYDSPEKVDL